MADGIYVSPVPAGRGADESFPVAETFHDWGFYSQVLWGFKKGLVAGIRGDYVDMQDSKFTDDLDRQSRWRLSANLTWYPTDFHSIAVQSGFSGGELFPLCTRSRVDLSPAGIHPRRARRPQILTHEKNSFTSACNFSPVFCRRRQN